MVLFVAFLITSSNKDKPQLVGVSTNWNKIVETWRKRIPEFDEAKFDSQGIQEIIDLPDFAPTDKGIGKDTFNYYSKDSFARFGWWPNFGFIHRWSLNISPQVWSFVAEDTFAGCGKLVIYEADDDEGFLDMFDPRGCFDIM